MSKNKYCITIRGYTRPLEVDGAVGVEGVDGAVVPVQNSDSGSCMLRPCILVWWLFSTMSDLIAFTPIQVIFIDIVISLTFVANYWPEPVFKHEFLQPELWKTIREFALRFGSKPTRYPDWFNVRTRYTWHHYYHSGPICNIKINSRKFNNLRR